MLNNVVSLKGFHPHNDDLSEITTLKLKELIKNKLSDSPFMTSTAVFNFGKRCLCAEFEHDQTLVALIPSFDLIKYSIYRRKSELLILSCNQF